MRRLMRNTGLDRVDVLINVSLGLAAVLAVVISLRATFKFATGLDQIAGRLRPHPTLATTRPHRNSDGISLTNVACAESRQAGASGISQAGFPGVGPDAACRTNLPGS